MVAVVEHPADVLDGPRHPEHDPERDALPQPHAERLAEVVAGDRLHVLHGVLLGQLHEPGEVERRPCRDREGLLQLRVAAWVGHDLQPPGLALKPHLARRRSGGRGRGKGLPRSTSPNSSCGVR